MLFIHNKYYHIIIIILISAFTSPVFANETIEVKAGTVAPDGTPWGELVKRIVKRMKTQSNDRIKVKMFMGGVLGEEPAMLRECRDGKLQLFGGSTSALASLVPEFDALELPYLFESDQEVDFVLDRVYEDAKKILAANDFIMYQWAENGWYGFGTKTKPVYYPVDLKGLKMRSQESKAHLETFRAYGSNPIPISIPEVLSSLQTGVVDGFDNTPLFSFATSWYQGIKYFTASNHIYQPGIVIYSKKWFDKQPKDIQAILLSGLTEDTKFGRDGVRALYQPLLDNFTAAGIKVIYPEPKAMSEFKEQSKKVKNIFLQQTTPAGKNFLKAIEKAKADYAKQKVAKN